MFFLCPFIKYFYRFRVAVSMQVSREMDIKMLYIPIRMIRKDSDKGFLISKESGQNLVHAIIRPRIVILRQEFTCPILDIVVKSIFNHFHDVNICSYHFYSVVCCHNFFSVFIYFVNCTIFSCICQIPVDKYLPTGMLL